jgi:hypothetical protein
MPHIPSLTKLLANYPGAVYTSGDSVAELIGGTVKANFTNPQYAAYKNTCAIRVSRALNYGGDPIPFAGAGLPNPHMADRKIRTDKGGDGQWYIYSVYDMRAYLSGRYGHPKRFAGTAKKSDLAGIKGIIAFAAWHVDIWDGTTCGYHNDGFGNAAVGKQDIVVWKTT